MPSICCLWMMEQAGEAGQPQEEDIYSGFDHYSSVLDADVGFYISVVHFFFLSALIHFLLHSKVKKMR